MAGRGSGGRYLLAAAVVKTPRSAFLKYPTVAMKHHIMEKSSENII